MKNVTFTTERVQRKPVGYRAPDGSGYVTYYNGTPWVVGTTVSPYKPSDGNFSHWEPIYEGDSLTITF